MAVQQVAECKINKLTKKDLLLIGTALYWAEGYKRGKWSIIFSNADPQMHKLMIKFFTSICQVPIEKIKAQIQIHHNIKPDAALAYWSKTIGLPTKQFSKPTYQLSKSSKLKRNNNLPYGTLRIRINNVELVNKIKGWIVGLTKNY
jgi:hypothetical protein